MSKPSSKKAHRRNAVPPPPSVQRQQPQVIPLKLEWDAFEPLQDYILAKVIRPDTGKIALPDGVKLDPAMPPKVEVVACGPGKMSDWTDFSPPCPVKPGDIIWFLCWGASEPVDIKIKGEEHVVIRYRDVMGIVKQSAPSPALALPNG